MEMYGFPREFALWSSAFFISGLRLLTWRFNVQVGR
jgi:hypothetical protein